jgi:hypothetical protein
VVDSVVISDRRVDGRRVLIAFFVVVDSIVGNRWDLVTFTAVVGGAEMMDAEFVVAEF